MAISLAKGAKLSLAKEAPGTNHFIVGIGWSHNRYDGAADFDVDVTAFVVDSNNKCTQDRDMVFYGPIGDDSWLRHPSGAVIHSPDDKQGDTAYSPTKDNETIEVFLNKLPPDKQAVIIAVTIAYPKTRQQSFGMIDRAHARLINGDTGTVIAVSELQEESSSNTAVEFCKLYRYQGEWKYQIIKAGYDGGLAQLCRMYGLDIEAEE